MNQKRNGHKRSGPYSALDPPFSLPLFPTGEQSHAFSASRSECRAFRFELRFLASKEIDPVLLGSHICYQKNVVVVVVVVDLVVVVVFIVVVVVLVLMLLFFC